MTEINIKADHNQRNREKYANATIEEKQRRKEKRRLEHQQKLANMSPEQLKEYRTKIKENWKRFDKNLSPEKKKQRIKLQCESTQRWWHTLSPEDKQKQLEAMKERHHNMSPEEKEQEKERLKILKQDPERIKNMRKYGVMYRANLRRLVISHYSNGAMRCMNPKCEVPGGAKTFEALCMDHINGGGRKHSKELGGHIYYWLVKNNYPPGFQVLCQNCNIIKKIENKEDYRK